jgi:ubiquinone/menaquinone biosynthesis C-methylase UbiE
MPVATLEAQGAAAAFDRMAPSYDDAFTRSLIGTAQRKAVWDVLRRKFRAGDRILELNCGTGEDALFLARQGMSIVACDASTKMLEVAKLRKAGTSPKALVDFRHVRNEELELLRGHHSFDGALSNFSGLNCVADLRPVARALGRLVRAGGNLVVCVSTRICLWEIAWYALRANFTKAFRRVGGETIAHLDGIDVTVRYPTIREMRRGFAPWFRVSSVRAVGLFVPPSYVESWAQKHRTILRVLEGIDRIFSAWPVFRGIGDHVLIEFVRADT